MTDRPDARERLVRGVLSELVEPPAAWRRAAKAIPRRISDLQVELAPVLARADEGPAFRVALADRLGVQATRRSEREWREAVLVEERRGEPLIALELAQRGLADHPGSTWLQHRAVLALARAGATARAARVFEQFGLARSDDPEPAALGARIAKDVALAATPADRPARAINARDRYAAIHARHPDFYPAINAATLSLLGGEHAVAGTFAREALALAVAAEPASFYSTATAAEAHLLLGAIDAAAIAIEAAGDRHLGDYGALATTRRQLRLVCDLQGVDHGILAPLAGPRVAHITGHRMAPSGDAGRFTEGEEASVACAMRAAMADRPVGIAYGALAAGADIMWAELLLAAGAELHVVLPFDADTFVASSVAPSGARWVARFDACLAAARSVVHAFDGPLLDDDTLFRLGTQHAMGLALLRARHLDAEAVQLALWDGSAARGGAGTAFDVRSWQSAGHESVVVDPWAARPAPAAGAARLDDGLLRSTLAIELRGPTDPSGADRHDLVARLAVVLAPVLAGHRRHIVERRTTATGLYLVIDRAVPAAALALALQERIAETDAVAAGVTLRVTVHCELSGSEVDAAPATPPGEVYVTEQVAAAVELGGAGRFACEYVGHLPNNSGVRMHRLRSSA